MDWNRAAYQWPQKYVQEANAGGHHHNREFTALSV